MYGKHVAPVDYSAFLQELPASSRKQYVIRNRSKPQTFFYATDNNPLYSTFSRTGYMQTVDPWWIAGKNEFDRQLVQERNHHEVLRRHQMMEEARKCFLQSQTSGSMSRLSLLEKTLRTISTNHSATGSRYSSGKGACDTRPLSAPPYVLGGNLNPDDLYMRPRAVETPKLEGVRCGGQLEPLIAPPIPTLQVQNACLVVEQPKISRPTSLAPDAADREVTCESAARGPPTLPTRAENNGTASCSSISYDKQLMHLLRGVFSF